MMASGVDGGGGGPTPSRGAALAMQGSGPMGSMMQQVDEVRGSIHEAAGGAASPKQDLRKPVAQASQSRPASQFHQTGRSFGDRLDDGVSQGGRSQ